MLFLFYFPYVLLTILLFLISFWLLKNSKSDEALISSSLAVNTVFLPTSFRVGICAYERSYGSIMEFWKTFLTSQSLALLFLVVNIAIYIYIKYKRKQIAAISVTDNDFTHQDEY